VKKTHSAKFSSVILTALITIAAVAQPRPARAAGWETLQAGGAGREVRALKLLLRHRNYDPGVIDTNFDQRTFESLADFQKQNGLAPTGIADAQTWEKLITPITPGEPLGQTNSAVEAVQYLLRDKYGFSALEADGASGAGTKAAVALFEYNYQPGGAAAADGSVNAETWSALIRDSERVNDRGWIICVELHRDRSLPGALRAFDARGRELLEIPCLGQSLTMNPDWRQEYANTPLGCFRADISHKWRDGSEYGAHSCVGLNDEDVRAATDGRAGILIHSGRSRYRDRADASLPYEYRDCRARTINGLDQTHGCVRISDAGHARLIEALSGLGKGLALISENEEE
jgi:peptidoglycan hydrolase-like protein with peptidoglycan-binding domain